MPDQKEKIEPIENILSKGCLLIFQINLGMLISVITLMMIALFELK